MNEPCTKKPLALASNPGCNAQGVALMTMIFILVVMGSAVVFMARLSQQQSATSSLAVQAARAQYAAMSGIFWAGYHINWVSDSSSALSQPSSPKSCPATTGAPEIINNLTGDLAGFTVTVTCTETDYTEGSNSIRLYDVVSTAEFGSLGDPDYVYKQITVVMETQS